jgi:hypothetical protein
MTMAIIMRIVIRIFFFATEVTHGPLSSVHYTHIKRTPNSRCVFRSGHDDTTKMAAHSRATAPPDLAGDLMPPCPCVLRLPSSTSTVDIARGACVMGGAMGAMLQFCSNFHFAICPWPVFLAHVV